MKTVVITCASGIATSTLVVNKVKKLCDDNQICLLYTSDWRVLSRHCDEKS